jgi:xanthine/CO dehydrogenase XdhC/CoxF family maturation factor
LGCSCAAAGRLGFGDDLAVVLGHDIAVDFLKAVLVTAMEGLRDGRSSRLVRDSIEAELARHLDRTDSSILTVVLRQLGLARDIAVAIADHIANRSAETSAKDQANLAEWARRIEENADRIAVDARAIVRRFNASAIVAQLVDTAEDTFDELEQAAYIASPPPRPALFGCRPDRPSAH